MSAVDIAATSSAWRSASRCARLPVAIGICVLVVIGLVMSMQSVSLLTGTGPVWTGVGVVGADTAVAFFMGAAKWVRGLAVVLLALSLFNAFYMEKQLHDMRTELSEVLRN
ncbi:MAG: hypothetical protein WBB07_15850 [Mycobacterium sp.]